MKKENKKMAQERRAAERAKKAQQEKMKEILIIAIPVVIIVVLLGWIIADAVTNKSSDSTESTELEVIESTEDVTVDDTVDDTDDLDDTDVTDDDGDDLYTGTDIAVADGDTVNIDYVGYIDGEAFSGGDTQGAGADLTIGSGMYIDTFEEQLIGHYVGETVEVVVTFPEDYGVEDLNGKEATFEVVINGIYQ